MDSSQAHSRVVTLRPRMMGVAQVAAKSQTTTSTHRLKIAQSRGGDLRSRSARIQNKGSSERIAGYRTPAPLHGSTRLPSLRLAASGLQLIPSGTAQPDSQGRGQPMTGPRSHGQRLEYCYIPMRVALEVRSGTPAIRHPSAARAPGNPPSHA